ncbi:MAG TPA: DNA polymerase IV, partial [Opitutaceae bacterium]
MNAVPRIAHLDADAFFVAVEQAIDPSLRGKKVAVGGLTRGIISSASYEARACGVYTPMPTARAKVVCPDLILVPHRSGAYGKVSRQLFDLCETVTPTVERRSIDEGYLDLAPCGHQTLEIAAGAVKALQRRIRDELAISVSFGLASNKLVSGIASKLNKPRGFTVVEPGGEAAFLAGLKVGRLPGVGAKTESEFNKRGIRLVSDLLALSDDELAALLGRGWRDFVDMARGIDDSPVETSETDAKSYSTQETFGEDIADRDRIERELKRMIDELIPKIRADGKRARTMTVKVRYPGMEDSSAAHSIAEASDLETDFYPHVAPLMRAAWKKRRPLRLVSVKFSGVEDPDGQMHMFGADDDRRHKLAAALDALRAKKGA